MLKKSTNSKIVKQVMFILQSTAQALAVVVCLGLLLASALMIFQSFQGLFETDIARAVDDGLFVLILLEMFYVVWSFIKYHTINVSLIVNVGIIATVKEMVFQLENMNLQLAISFAVIFFTLSLVYFAEAKLYELEKENTVSVD